MTDSEWIHKIEAINDPIAMLRAIIEYEDFLGYDPYYRDLRETLLNRAAYIIGTHPQGHI